MKKFLALFLALAMVLTLAACQTQPQPTEPAPTQPVATKPVETQPVETQPAETEPVVEPVEPANLEFDVLKLANLTYGEDYQSLSEVVGEDVKIEDVIEDPETGFAYIELEDGSLHELGLDFLTMAMVYNLDTCADYPTVDDVYAAWWRLYITRWNYLLPEVPLYSNEYYDLYNAKIKGVEEFPTNPYWDPSLALIDWTSEKEDHDIILGNNTELSGQFRYPTFGKFSPGASDSDVGDLVNGLSTVTNTKEGGYVWDNTVVKEHSEVVNEDGTKTYTITIQDDLKFSNGEGITAKDYLAFTLALSSPVGVQASGRKLSMNTVVGGPDFIKYEGPGSEAGSKELAGLRLLDEYTFSVTIPAAYIPYFYDITYAAFSPSYSAMWLGEGVEIMDDGNGVYLSDNFYEKNDDGYTHAAQIKFAATDTTEANWTQWPFTGAYMVQSFDNTDSTAVLVKNPEYKGNYEGVTPKIEKITYRKVVAATQLEDFKAGGLDVIAAITGGKETDEAIAAAKDSNGAYVYTHYSRAGYGKLGFRADYGPVQFREVRAAIAYCMNRPEFAKDFTGGYGGVVDGPYYTGSWMYKAAVAQGMELDAYATSSDSAIDVLVEGGWVYDKDGNDYVEGIRYKKIPADVANENIINYKSMDGAYATTKVGDDYYMPLVINWFGTTPNEFTDLLQTGFRENANIEAAGMKVYNQLGAFQPMLDELYQQAVYGYYAGTPMYCAFNFATGFSSAAYDYSWNMTIDPSVYDDYSSYYIKDYADIYWLK